MWNKIKEFFRSIMIADEEIENVDDETQDSVSKYEAPKNKTVVKNLVGSSIYFHEIRTEEEKESIAESLVKGQAVIVNFRKLPAEKARDIQLFLKGVMYSKGSIVQVSDEVFVYLPEA